MKTSTTPVRAAFVLASSFILHPSSFLHAQGGPLTPPGAPVPTMKTLEQIEPRTPISSLPFTISAAGSYFVTGNLSGTQGISIDADHVTLDLGGFELAGSGGVGHAIGIPNSHDNITIRNGTVRNWGGDGVASQTSDSTEVRVENLRVISNGFTGILLNDNSTVVNCEARGNPGRGIKVGAFCKITGCTTTGQTGANGFGIEADGRAIVSGCVTAGNSNSGIKVGDGSLVTECIVHGNAGASALLAGAGCSIINCTVDANTSGAATSQAISGGGASRISRCTVTGTLTSTTATLSTGAGIVVGSDSVVEECLVYGNRGDGIRGNYGSTFARNTSIGSGNGAGDGAGIHVTSNRNRIEGNHLQGNVRGIDVDGTDNTVVRNTASGNSTNYDIIAANSVGAIVNPGNSVAINGNGPLASSLVTTDPWANLSE